MDIVIFDMGGDWAFASPNLTEQALPPFTIQGAFLSYKLWRADNLLDDQWDAAKTAFLRLAGDLRKPGRRKGKRAA